MYVFIGLLIALGALSLYLWKFQTEYFSKVVLGLGAILGSVAELAAQLGLFDWSTILPPRYAGLAMLAVIVIGWIARFTKSKLAPEA